MSILNERVDSKITDFKAYIYDYSILKVLKEEKNSMENFWDIKPLEIVAE